MLRAAFASLAVAAVLLAFACDDPPVPHPCTGIPEGGCPLEHGLSCEDPTCAAVYLCRANNVWELQQYCAGYDAAANAVVDAGAPSSTVIDASTDAPAGAFGGPGCEPLQNPDCSAGLALACGKGCCDCEDLFVCVDGAWELWGECDPDAGIRTP